MWTLKKGIQTPAGLYNAESDELIPEIMKAAKFAGLESFNVKVDGEYVDNPGDMEATDFSEVTTVEIEAYDTAG